MASAHSVPSSAPVLSTPENFDTYTPADSTHSRLSDEALTIRYEIQRTVQEIRQRRWRRIALQFPDHMLQDGPRVFELLQHGLRKALPVQAKHEPEPESVQELEHEVKSLNVSEQSTSNDVAAGLSPKNEAERLYILGDTSYGACCVDEIAAEHVSADAVVHYGRACLSPTTKLPVLYIFTEQPLDMPSVVSAFESTYPEKDAKVLLAADVTYISHVASLHAVLLDKGYTNLFATDIINDPSSLIPNRTVPVNVSTDSAMQEWSLFHISQPPASLLLTLASRVSSVNIYPTSAANSSTPATCSVPARSMPLLRRRYGLLTRLRTASILGILVNTLSVSTTLPLLAKLKKMIADARKKSYTVVVGKVNAAKLANFAEVDGWVVVGCWESSLLDDEEGKGGSGWWKPCITPWELELALGEEGAWKGDWSSTLDLSKEPIAEDDSVKDEQPDDHNRTTAKIDGGPLEDEEEDEPPVFDLRTGRYVSNSRPIRATKAVTSANGAGGSQALAKRARGDLAVINGQASPGAAFLREKRTWKGLGSDFEIAYEDEQGAQIEEGRSGIARGYGEKQ